MARPSHIVADIQTAPGQFSFETRIDGAAPQRVRFRVPDEVRPGTQAVLPTTVLPLMRSGGSLEVEEPLSPRLLRCQPDFQAIQRYWSRDWPFGAPPLEEVEIRAPVRDGLTGESTKRVAAFFSGGVDSWSTVIDNPDLTDLIFVRGFDLDPTVDHQRDLIDDVESRLREVATGIGLPLHVVETDLRRFSDPLIRWEAFYSSALAAVALLFESCFDRVLIPGDGDHEIQAPIGSAQLIDQLWGTELLEIADDGGRLSREERLDRIAGNPLVQSSLRVCWHNTEGAYNCCRCRKCVMTMISLDAMGVLPGFETFPLDLNLSIIDEFEITQPIQLALWEDTLDTVRTARRPELERPTEALVNRGRQALGLPPSHRTRRVLGPPPSKGAEIPAPQAETSPFLATPETAAQLAEASLATVLIGGYDGSGNYGDIAQLDSTLELLKRLDVPLLALPVVELSHAADHAELTHSMRNRFPVLYFEPGPDTDPELVPVDRPQRLALGVCHLYGGGYLNRLWGARKLATLRAAETLLGGAARVCKISSGTQAEADWIDALGEDDLRTLMSLELLGARDAGSVEALRRLGSPAPVLDTKDDILGLLAELPPGPPKAEGRRVAIHFAEHDFVTETRGPLLRFYAELLGELQKQAGEPLLVQPLIAYVDRRIDERPGLAELQAACVGAGVELAKPITLRPTGLADDAGRIGRASLTLSCSYHVALTSLMLGVPTVLIEKTPYYEQKAAGLRKAFSSPLGSTVSSREDPASVAAALARVVFDPAKAGELRARLRGEAEVLRGQRNEAEATILAKLGGAALTAVSNRAGPLAPLNGDAEAQLAQLLSSRSWRLTEPLRRLAALIRAGRGRR